MIETSETEIIAITKSNRQVIPIPNERKRAGSLLTLPLMDFDDGAIHFEEQHWRGSARFGCHLCV